MSALLVGKVTGHGGVNAVLSGFITQIQSASLFVNTTFPCAAEVSKGRRLLDLAGYAKYLKKLD
jgi:hypothetical protein